MSNLAEQNIIGSLLLNGAVIEKLNNVLTSDMFYNQLLGRIYLEYQRGYDNRYEVNLPVIYQKLQEDFPEVVIADSIKECMANTDTSANVLTNAEVIRKDWKAYKFAKMIDNVKIAPDQVDNQIALMISNLESMQEAKASDTSTLAEITREYKDSYFKDNEKNRINFGFDKLDDLIGGAEDGDMIVIGARPSVGKSALVTQITSNIRRQGKKVGFYNLEMKAKQMYERFVVNESGIKLTRLRRAKEFLGDEKERFDKANEVLEKADNIVITSGSKKMSEIRNECRHMNYDILIIDYMQLIRADETYRGNRYAEVGAISRAIKALAMELNIPIIALSQLNRASEGKETKEPTMSELREAGDIEQDASVIVLLWNLNEDGFKKGCKVEKNRQGTKGKIVMEFDGNQMQFVETDETIKEAAAWVKAPDDIDNCPFV